jgi:hypothetical protein
LNEVFDFENGFFGAPYQPEDNCIDVDGNGIAGQGRFCTDGRDAYALIDVAAHGFYDRDDEEEPRTAQAAISAEAERATFCH